MKELRLLALERMADELEHPPHNEKPQPIKPQPMNEDTPEEQRQRNQNYRYPQRMAHSVHRMPMATGILRDPLFVRARFVSAAAQHSDLIIRDSIEKVGDIAGLRAPVQAC